MNRLRKLASNDKILDALYEAIRNDEHEKIIDFFRSGKVDPEVTDPRRNNENLLHFLIREDIENIGFFISLAKSNTNITHKNKNGDTPLHLCCELGTDLCKPLSGLLVQAGSDVNAKNNDGDTPMMVATKNNNAEFVGFLLVEGADSTIRNKKRETPYMVARDMGLLDVEELLLELADVDREDEIEEWEEFLPIKKVVQEAHEDLIISDGKKKEKMEELERLKAQSDEILDQYNQLNPMEQSGESGTNLKQEFSYLSNKINEIEKFLNEASKRSRLKKLSKKYK